jgi:HSP20 family protein
MELKSLAPWNWFSKEEELERSVPVNKVPVEKGRVQKIPATFPNSAEGLFDTLFGNVFEDLIGGNQTPLGAYGLLKPQVDLRAEDKEYILTVEIPGVTEKDVMINVADNAMTITGEKKQEKETKEGNYYRMERSYGSFQRVLSLPDDIDQDNIQANFKHGVLTVTMPRQKIVPHTGKTIEITSS